MAGQVARQRANDLRQMRQTELPRQGRRLVKALNASSKGATGGDQRLSGLGNRPRIGATAKTESGRNTTTVTVTPSSKRAKAPFVWLDSGTDAGFRRGRYRKTYFHPGTRGKGAWSDPVDKELPKIRRELRSRFSAISR